MLCGLLFALAVRPADAHKINVYASALGRTVKGRVYFPGGGRARDTMVEVIGPGGEELGRVRTDENGEFTFQAQLKCDHTFVVDPGDGHRAAYVLEADELPDDLPAPDSAVGRAETTALEQTPPAPSPEPKAADVQALAAQVQALREELEGYEGRTRLRDVLGGIGYILGIAGIVFYFAGRGRREAGRRRSD